MHRNILFFFFTYCYNLFVISCVEMSNGICSVYGFCVDNRQVIFYFRKDFGC